MIGMYLRVAIGVILLLALGVVGVAYAKSSAQASVHHLSLRVVDDGREVMSPTVQMMAGDPVQLSVGSSKDGYTLALDIVDQDEAAAAGTTAAVQVALWRGAADTGIQLLDRVIPLARTNSESDVSSTSSGFQSSGASVDLISHAVDLRSVDDLGAVRACGEDQADSSVQVDSGAFSQRCCGRICANDNDDGNQTLTCCSTSPMTCCGCGVCCGIS